MKLSKYFIILLAVLIFAISATATIAVIYSSESTAFLSGTLMTTPLWEYLVVNWVGTGVLELAIGIYIVLYMAPKGVDKMVSQGIKEAKNSPELAPLLDKFKEIMAVMEPAVKQISNALKNFDIEKTQKDLHPLLEALKNVNPEDINAVLKNVKELTGTALKVLEKPKLPEPLPEPQEES